MVNTKEFKLLLDRLIVTDRFSMEVEGIFVRELSMYKNKSQVLLAKERVMIVKAMNFGSPGHWFKCPKGHIYSIGECGGAVSESVCNECGSRIGGAQHRLRVDNAVATEMDGARVSAYDMNAALYRV